jgi:hypothetical protein
LISPVVTIDVMPADAPAEYAPAMVTACSQGLPEGKCALARETSESTQAEAVALVLWQGDQFLQVTVRVGRHGSEWVTRNLAFTERDALLDRWTAVGLTVATLVGEGKAVVAAPETTPVVAAHNANPEPKPARETVPPVLAPSGPSRPSGPNAPSAPSTPPGPAAARTPFAFSVALGGLAGPAWQAGDWQRGVWLSATVGQRSRPWMVEGFASYAHSNGPTLGSSGALQSRWLSAGVGLGAAGAIRALNLRFGAALELLFRHISADLGAAHAGDDELPVRVRLLGAWPARGALGVVFGGALRIPVKSTSNGTGAQARQPLLSGELQVGVEARF